MRSRIAAGISLLAIAYVLVAGSNFLLTLTIGRSLGAAALGHFTVAVAVARLFYSGTDLGLAPHLTRVATADRSRTREIASLFITFRLAMIPIAITIAAVAAFSFSPSDTLTFCLIALAIGFLNLQLVFEAMLLAVQAQRTAALLTGFGACCVIAACAGWHLSGGSLLVIAIAYAAATGLALVGWAYWTGTQTQVWPRLWFQKARFATELRESWPIGVSLLLSLAALRCPTFVLGLLTAPRDVGAFAAAEMFVTAGGIIQGAVTNSVFPRLAATYRTDPKAYRTLFWGANALLAGCGLMIGLVLTLFGDTIATIVFPSADFERVKTLMPIIGWSTPALLIAHHTVLVFAAANHERMNLRLMTAWLLIIAAFQAPMVWVFGLEGAAWGLLFGRLAGLAVLAMAVRALTLHRGAS